MAYSCSVDANELENLYSTISDWKNTQARSEEGLVDHDEFENEMDRYLNTLDEFEKLGVRKIGEGRDRITFTSGSIVDSNTTTIIKMSKSGGAAQNTEEVEIWRQMGDEARKNVAWILDSGPANKWIIQERVSQHSKTSATEEVRDNLADSGWTCSDIRPENIGMRETDLSSNRPERHVLMDLGVGLREI